MWESNNTYLSALKLRHRGAMTSNRKEVYFPSISWLLVSFSRKVLQDFNKCSNKYSYRHEAPAKSVNMLLNMF